MPTYLETLIEHAVHTSLSATLSRTTERIAEDMAAEILSDPTFRRQMRELIARAFAASLTQLAAPAPADPDLER